MGGIVVFEDVGKKSKCGGTNDTNAPDATRAIIAKTVSATRMTTASAAENVDRRAASIGGARQIMTFAALQDRCNAYL